MKKLISLLLMLAMILSLCACGQNGQISEEDVAEAVEVIEEVLPDFEAMAAEAMEMFRNGDYSQLLDALDELKDSGLEVVDELMGICHYYGYGTEIDADKAMELLEESSSLIAQYIQAEAAMTGNGAVRNPETAEELYETFVKLAEAKEITDGLSGSEFAALADCYAHGFGTELDLDEAKAAAAKAIEAGELAVFEMAELGEFIMGAAQDALDNIEAELNESGYGIIDLQDPSKTAYMLEPQKFIDKVKAAEAEIEKSNELYREAKAGILALAEEGNVIALKLMGDYYFGALGGETQDYAKAMEYYTQAAELEYAPAQAQLGLMYQDGLGVDVNYEQAMEWNNRAAMQGNAQGQAQIGYLYHMGLGVTQNLDEAGRWYSRAADQGDTWAAAKLQQTEITNPQAAFEFHA